MIEGLVPSKGNVLPRLTAVGYGSPTSRCEVNGGRFCRLRGIVVGDNDRKGECFAGLLVFKSFEQTP
jgi:hypothetical protein